MMSTTYCSKYTLLLTGFATMIALLLLTDRLKVHIPNSHQSNISAALLKRILEQADVSLQE
jgi:hypothetical protein